MRHKNGFAWDNYAPAHRQVIAYRLRQAKRLARCSLCGTRHLRTHRVLVHVCLTRVGAEALDARPFIKALALCRTHEALSNDDLADRYWPGWRKYDAR
jgi:hypothetical protein